MPPSASIAPAEAGVRRQRGRNLADLLPSLKTVALVAVLLPGAWLLWRWWAGTLGPLVYKEAIHQTGLWATRFLLLTLLVTPLRRVAFWNRLIAIRRTLGLAALGYAILHVILYCLDQSLDVGKIVSEIVLRFYLTIGLIAVLALVVLGATSTDGMVRRIGPERWSLLHKLTYPATALALWHFFLQSKLEVWEAALVSGLFFLLMVFRLLWRLRRTIDVPSLVALAVLAAFATAALEMTWYGWGMPIPLSTMVMFQFDFETEIRPAWWVMAAGLLLVPLHLVRAQRQPRRVR